MADSEDKKSETGPVYFWRETEVPYGFLSQWYECRFERDGIVYRSTEMWMMIQKAMLFEDTGTREKMIKAQKPSQHRALGRQVKGFDKAKWDENKSRIVEEGNWLKFTASKESGHLKKLLLETNDRELVEASPYDTIWGIGYPAAQADQNRESWGENLLGKALMRVRTRIREQQ